MRQYLKDHSSYWILNLATSAVSWAASREIVRVVQSIRGGSSGPYLGQLLLYPGVYLLTWSALTVAWYQFGWLGKSREKLILLNSRSVPLKAALLLLFIIFTKTLGLSSTSSQFGNWSAVILIFIFGLSDRWLIERTQSSSRYDKALALFFLLAGFIMVFTGTPLHGLLVGQL